MQLIIEASMQHMRAQFHHSATYFAISIAPPSLLPADMPCYAMLCYAMQCNAMPGYAAAIMRPFKGTDIEALIGHIVNIVQQNKNEGRFFFFKSLTGDLSS